MKWENNSQQLVLLLAKNAAKKAFTNCLHPIVLHPYQSRSPLLFISFSYSALGTDISSSGRHQLLTNICMCTKFILKKKILLSICLNNQVHSDCLQHFPNRTSHISAIIFQFCVLDSPPKP